MTIFPAIDLLDGNCVRLKQGAEKTAKIYSTNPVEIARKWQQGGAKIIHVVNLDGAFGRASENIDVIKEIVAKVEIPIQLGGGIRTFEDAHGWLSIGVNRVILGTVALTDQEMVAKAMRTFGPEKIILGLDARGSKVAIEGWEKQTEKDTVELALEMKALGVERVIYTDVDRDGESVGPNIERTDALAKETGLKIIASGGFSKEEHFQALHDTHNPLLEGAIVGTALYEEQLELKKLIKQFGK